VAIGFPGGNVCTNANALAEGIPTGHLEMPQFRFEPDQISDLIAFLQSLE
jgi:cytochrome c